MVNLPDKLELNTGNSAFAAAEVNGKPAVLRGPNRPDLLRNETLPGILADTARRLPQHPALIWGNRVVNYGELNDASDRIGRALARRGAAPGSVIGLFMGRGADLLIAQAGITKSGAAWLPFDAETPFARIQTCLQSAHAIGLVTCREWLPRLQTLPVPVWAVEDLMADDLPKTIGKLKDDADPLSKNRTLTSPRPSPLPYEGSGEGDESTVQGVKAQNSFRRILTPNLSTNGGEGEEAQFLKNPKPEDAAYVIYTSGSTGEPKGIVISHRSICHFLRSENEVLKIHENDKVYQGFSVAFDMSFEEIWISWLVGATLWIAPPTLVADPDLIAETLTRERITVLHAVPTLMGLIAAPSQEPDPHLSLRLRSEAMADKQTLSPPSKGAEREKRSRIQGLIAQIPSEHSLPTLRIINLGGEACPDALAARLTQPGRKLFNTYGPTEISVTASVAELKPGDRVSIGMPLPNYGLLVVDEDRRVLAAGEVGELCIFGPGLATGYLGLPELTAERFVSNPVAENSSEARMYLTGDLARIEPGGPVHCLGRADSQVKIRGFRVELEEIAAALSAQPGVAAAAVIVRPFAGGEELVGFVVLSKNSRAASQSLRQALAARLPHYMVPAHFEFIVELPRLVSGKINHHALRSLPLKLVEHLRNESSRPHNEDEAALFAALESILPGHALQADADFFNDLGGHSLLVARLVSRLRGNPKYAALSVQDVYRERTLFAIANVLERLRHRALPESLPPRAIVPRHRRWLCGLAQAMLIPCFVLLNTADWLAPFFVYHYFTGDEGDSIPLAVLYSLGTFVLARFAIFVIAIAGKRFVAGRLKAGRYPLWGVTYFRWWLSNRFCELPDLYLLASTPWMPLYLRALGARVGRDTMIDAVTMGAPELLTIEDGVSIGTFVNLENARVEAGSLILGSVHLKRECSVESYAVLENDTTIGEHAQLRGQSALAAGREIPDGEIWEGAPARNSNQTAASLPPRPQIGFFGRWAEAGLFAVTAILVSVLFFLPTFPAFMLIDWLDAHTVDVFDSGWQPLPAFGLFFVLAIPASALFVVVTMLATAGLRWLLPRQTAGTFSVHSRAFWLKKSITLILDGSLRELHGLYASVFAPTWLRCLGVKVGRHSEVSTAEGMVPELLSLGDDSFIADGALLGDEEQRGGWMILKPTTIGNRSFVGNGAYVGDGAVVPDDVLIGAQTRVPANDQMKPGQTWMGSPPILLPAREQLAGFPESLTFRPSPGRRLARGIVEALRIVLPLALVIATGYLIVVLVMPMASDNGWGIQVALALSLAGCLYGLGSFLIVVALKWICVGRYRPRAAPMWTPFVWLSEAVTNLYESLAVPNFLDHLRGTPMLPWALRALGVKIGKGVYLDTTDMTEFDCVRIGDEAELNAWCGPQTHLFEDRVMKIGMVEIGAQVTVGPRATILYDTKLGDRVRLGPLTLVAKGEHLPAGTEWEGSPAATSRGR